VTSERDIRTVIPTATMVRPPGPAAEPTKGRTMPMYVIERNYAEQLDPDALDQAGIKLVNDDVGIRWIYSFLSADQKKTYCLYEAPNPEAIREAAARLGLPADVIVAVEQIGPVRA
jgi:Nickel responsive protein SCO4226-like